ncbi:MAG: hypothetical protein Q9213_006540 [Squamulea squamosa]
MTTPNTSHYKPAPTPRPPTSASVMTPASFSASSPAPPPSSHSNGAGHRSHQSPAHFSSSSSSTTKAGKSPFNHLQQTHLLASPAGGQHMSRSGTNTSSPGTIPNMSAFAGLNAMLMNAVEGGTFKTGLTPAGGIGTPGVDGVSPLPSHLGVGDAEGPSVNGSMVRQQIRDQEEERRLRLENIVRLLGQRWGFVSREGVERCARRVGLECLWEDELPGMDGRTLSIAGNSVLVEVTFMGKGDDVGSVTLGFPEREDGEWGQSAQVGAEVLKKDLKGDVEDPLDHVDLAPFVGNLQRLGTLDRLGTGAVNCFDAIDGVGRALRKIWEAESKKRKQEKQGEVQEDIELNVMCKDSGKPSMHAGGRVGLALQYWKDIRHLTSRKRKADEMDVDDAGEDTAANKASTWSANIECQSSSADLYPSIHVSSDWVSETVIKTPADQQDPFSSSNNDISHIDWQDPPPTFVTTEPSTSGAMDHEADTLLQQKPPDVRFIARFHPPVLVPVQTAVNIFNTVGVREAMQPTMYDSLLLPNRDGTPYISSTERVVEREIYSPANDDLSKEIRLHRYTFFADPQAYARNIEELPFSHPKEIVALLPVLRQWAFVSSILRRCFHSTQQCDGKGKMTNGNAASTSISVSDSDSESDSDSNSDNDGCTFPVNGSTFDLEAFLNPKYTSISAPQARPIDVSISTTGSCPRISLVFPRKGEIANISFTVEENADIGSIHINLGESSAGDVELQDGANTERLVKRRENVKKILELSEDLGLLVEWIEH